MKFCRGCETEQPLENFSVAKRGKDGRAYYCRPCAAAKRREQYKRTASPDRRAAEAARMRQYLRSNPEQAAKGRQRSLDWAKRNAGKVNARNAAWRAANPDRSAGFTRAWREAHPMESLAQRHRRLARLAAAPVNDFTAAQWREVLDEFHHACAYCLRSGIPLQQEHVEAISRGGSNTRSNIVPACADCNNRKGSKGLVQALAAGCFQN